MTLVVQKYGGTSVGSIQHIRNVANHVAGTVRDGARVLVSVSAMGEQTDELVAMARQLSPNPPRREMDMLLTAGERISMALLSMALHDLGIHAVSLTGSQCGILTDETHGNARIHKILGDRIREGLANDKVVIVAGFQGVSPRTKEITTLGRGGTDLSAIALAASLQADRCELYKDVLGVYSADPRVVPEARKLAQLSWRAMTTLAWSGANVLHPRSAHLAAKYEMGFEIRSSLQPSERGTMITGVDNLEDATLAALAHQRDMALVTFSIKAADAAGCVSRANAWLWEQGVSPTLNRVEGTDAGGYHWQCLIPVKMVAAVVAEFGDELVVAKQTDNVAAITLAGSGFLQSPEIGQRYAQALGQKFIAFAQNNNELTAVVAGEHMAGCLQSIHSEFFPAET